ETPYRLSLELARALVESNPGILDYLCRLGATEHNLALLLGKAGRREEARHLLWHAVRHQKAALKAAPGHPQYREFLRNHYFLLAEVLLQLGQRDAAARAAAELPRLYPGRWNDCLTAARLLAQCAGLARSEGKLTEEQRQALAREHEDQALEALRAAVRNGLPDVARLGQDRALEGLRRRPELQQLLQGAR